LQEAFEQAARGIDAVSELAPDFVRLHDRAQQLSQRAQRFAEPCASGSVRTVTSLDWQAVPAD